MAIKKKIAKKAAPKSAPKAKPAPKKVVKAAKKAKPAPAPKKKAAKAPVSKTAKVAKPAPKKAAPVKSSTKGKTNAAPKKDVKHTQPIKKQTKPIETKSMAKKTPSAPDPKKAVKATVKEPKKEVVVEKRAEPVVAKAEPAPKAVKAHAPAAKPAAASKETDNRLRYSDKELLEFKELILQKIESTRSELKYYQDQVKRTGDNSTDDTENRYSSEDGIGAMEREHYMQMASRLYQYIDHLEKAIIRIENKTYGICRVTGKLIDKERLRAVPHATLSLEAKLMQKKETANVPANLIPAANRLADDTERTPEE